MLGDQDLDQLLELGLVLQLEQVAQGLLYVHPVHLLILHLLLLENVGLVELLVHHGVLLLVKLVPLVELVGLVHLIELGELAGLACWLVEGVRLLEGLLLGLGVIEVHYGCYVEGCRVASIIG